MPMPKPQPDRRRRMSAPGRITATARVSITGADASSSESPPRFRMVAYTGEPMRIWGFDCPVVVDLESADLSEQRIPALYDHWADLGSVVGQVDGLAIENKQLVSQGVFTIPPRDPQFGMSCAERVLALARAGYQWQASVGADPATIEKIEAGASGVANWGREYPGPCVIARGCRFRELSFVVLGGDRRTSVVAARVKGAAMTFEQWLLSLGFDDPTSLTDVQRANLELMYQDEYPDGATDTTSTDTGSTDTGSTGTTTDPVTGADDDEEQVAAGGRRPPVRGGNRRPDPVAADNLRIAANRRRVAAINALETEFGPVQIEVAVNGRKARVDLYAHAIEQGWSRERTELAAVRESRPQGPHLHVPGGAPPITGDAGATILEAALCQSLGIKNLEKQGYKPDTLEAAHKHFRGLGLQQVLLMAAAANGYACSAGQRIHGGNIREVLRYAFAPVRAASTVSLPGILGNVANKELLLGYMEEDQTWREVAAVKTVNNFHQVTSYRMLDSMEYEEVGADGKIKHGSVDQESFTRQAKTYAKMFALTRRDIINDDLGAFDDLRNRLGRGAAKKFNNVFWAKFLYDHATFFTTARTNYITGATTTLLTDGVGLGLAVKAFRQMTSPSADGTKRIGGNPDRLIVPPELEAAAEALYANQNLGAVKSSDANIYANKYRPVVVPWLSDSSFTGYSTTAWYLFRNPAELPMMVASFLNGNEAPTVEDTDADFDTLGVQFRGYHDFGCDQAEYLCGIKSKGAA